MRLGPLLFLHDTRNFGQPVWCCFDSWGYLYFADTLLGLLWTLARGWRRDAYLAG